MSKEANANLISAAPEMYKALKELLTIIAFNASDRIPASSEFVKQAQVALKKARGES